MAFLRKTNFVLFQFKSSDPHVKMKLFQAYCISFYGSSLWRLDCPELNFLSVAFNNVIRRIWNLPQRSHTSVVHCLHCNKSWSAQAWKRLGNVHMCPSQCPSQCPSMYTPSVYKEWPSSSSSVQGVSKLVHMLRTNWPLAWAHTFIAKQFPSLATPTSTAELEVFIILSFLDFV